MALTDILFSPYLLAPEIAALAVLLVTSVLGVMYIISPLLGQTSIRTWIRTKFYEEMSSLVFIFAFLVFGALIFTFPITGAFTGLGIVPNQCNPAHNSALAQTIALSSDPSMYSNLYFLSLCDMNNYNGAVSTFNVYTYYLAGLTSIAPMLGLQFPPRSQSPISEVSQAAEGAGVEAGGVGLVTDPPSPESTDNPNEIPPIDEGGVTDTGIGISTSIELLPISPTFHYVIPMLNMLYIFFILSQVQMLLIASSALIYAILMSLGLVARSFGITRTFGGAMIAFAIGIGFIYPLMTAISYGFLDYSIQIAGHQFVCTFNPIPDSLCGGQETLIGRILGAIGAFVSDIFTLNPGGAIIAVTASPVILPIFRSFVIYSGLIAMGLSLIPLLNLTVVDAFIVDFSKSIGERMDFLSLLTRIL